MASLLGSGDIVRDASSLSVVGERSRTEAETSPGVPFDSAQGTHHVHVTTTAMYYGALVCFAELMLSGVTTCLDYLVVAKLYVMPAR